MFTRFDFIVIAPLLPSHCGFSFVFGCGVSFLVSSSVFLSMIVHQLVVILDLSQEGVLMPYDAFIVLLDSTLERTLIFSVCVCVCVCVCVNTSSATLTTFQRSGKKCISGGSCSNS